MRRPRNSHRLPSAGLGLLHLHVDVDVDILVQVVARQRGGRDLRPRDLAGGRAAALVVHQVVPPTEPHLTVLALERLLALVDQQMSLQLIRVAELRRAQLARVRTLARVHAQVPTQVRYLHELSVAVAAVVRLLARVQPHVCLQMMIPRESGMNKERVHKYK